MAVEDVAPCSWLSELDLTDLMQDEETAGEILEEEIFKPGVCAAGAAGLLGFTCHR